MVQRTSHWIPAHSTAPGGWSFRLGHPDDATSVADAPPASDATEASAPPQAAAPAIGLAPDSGGNLASRGGLSRVSIARVAAYVEARLDRALPLSELSSLLGLSAFHFARSFRRTIGVSPHQYVLLRRVERARALLLDGLPVTETARRVGFWDQSHLSRHFKRCHGVTPRRFAVAARARAA